MENSISLPFEFRTTKVRWEKVRARIKGWYRRGRILNSENLVAEVVTSDGKMRSIPFPLERLTGKEWEECVPTMFDDGSYERISDADVEQVCSEFEPELLVSNRTDAIGRLESRKVSGGERLGHARRVPATQAGLE